MTVGIVGLGLIGGSFAKAYHDAGHRVLGFDTDRSVLGFAALCGAVDAELTDEALPSCDLILVCIAPPAAIEWFRAAAPKIGPHPVVIDSCGTKRVVCAACFAIAKENGVTFLGGHPMAGVRDHGFKFSTAEMFRGAPMVIVPPDFNSIELLGRVKELLAPAGFASISITTAEEHDKMIAFTSQMAHVVSNAYIKSPTAASHKGFSAGSYKDMTRVAWLNPRMWAELFLENRDNLLFELDELIGHLNEYRSAMQAEDLPRLVRLLEDGKRRKEEVDGH